MFENVCACGRDLWAPPGAKGIRLELINTTLAVLTGVLQKLAHWQIAFQIDCIKHYIIVSSTVSRIVIQLVISAIHSTQNLVK